MTILMLAAVLAAILMLAFFRASIAGWVLAAMLFVPVMAIQLRVSDAALQAVYVVLFLFVALFGIPTVRRILVSGTALKIFRKILPQISATERESIDAGTVWWDGDLFGGHPDWNKLLAFPKCGLSAAEQAFLDNEVEQLCAMLDDWDITHRRADLPPEVWQFMKVKGFFGMIIPKRYGGLEFSAQAHSAVVCKVASRSATAAVTVMVPNSLGPAELLLHYGTEEQKEKYLHRLAYGLEVPCFALTGPFAGSDAGAIPDYGEVCYDDSGGRRVLGVRLTWEKRYITLAPSATLLGLAFKLYDPARILGGEVERGITLALIPANLPGVRIGRRHFPLNSAFLNGPTQGNGVFVPIECIIGGIERVGQGWRMLMECLAAGRSISLPASSVGGMKLAARTSGAYARVRKQFHLPIGKFEGIEEPLARIGAYTYLIDAARRFTALAVDMGEQPSVISAIVKYHATECGRSVVNDAMDVHGGKGICLGPGNYLGRAYQQAPIGITVEGANILTRSMIIFGQGAIRAHPYVLKEIAAAHEPNPRLALQQFDEALFGHIGFVLCNAARSLVFALCNGRGIPAPPGSETRRYYQQLTRFSAAFALSADVAMAVLGGSLKRREKISARLGDALSMLYLGSAALKRFEDDGRPAADLPLLHWAMQDALYKTQQAFDGVLRNFPNAPARRMLGALVFPLGMRLSPPSDRLGHEIATLLMQPGAARDRLTAGMYLPTDEQDAVGALEAALASTLLCEPLQEELEKARKAGKLKMPEELPRITEARDQSIITAEQALQLERDYALRRKVIMVDDFGPEELRAGR
ncbi:MAG: acyl-CoA dehydrogenase [Gallionellales bacterium RIFCSPLOWO2_12_FULL_59_22]|nr:MAG: acyl-CoA dehydrogenase [Gallionellales bacterium RIFCSPLOWO2_02_FULL_59_110]OGT12918.1 MAG: acyl-CoA dehydrogenase [Gallionellales bacterium RIFCSPLOWO2_12_FULL_59_22]